MSELSKFQEEVGKWGDETFNHSHETSSYYGLIRHLQKEVVELRRAIEKQVGGELADCLILLLNIAHISGHDLLDESRKKMDLNRVRTWKKPDANGVIEHIKEETPQQQTRN